MDSSALLLFVFATHLPFFLWKYKQTGQPRFAATSVTFALLTLTYGVRLFAPEATLGDTPLYMWIRIPAWIAATLSIGLLIRHFAKRRSVIQ